MKDNRTEKIVEFFLRNPTGGSSDIHLFINSAGIKASLITIKRDLSELTISGILEKHEKGPETSYSLTGAGRIHASVDAHAYCSVEPDKRYGQSNYNFALFEDIKDCLFSKEDINVLTKATEIFIAKSGSTNISEILTKKELERFVIELSWKSSRIEGNTYSLLDTERLLKEGLEATGHSKEETTMVINHKVAFDFAYSDKQVFKEINRANTEKIHSLIVSGLPIKEGYRHGMVGVTGSKYRPLENEHQIKESMDDLFSAVNKMEDPYSKALLALIGISYIQPFEDGNKRTSRMMTNAILMAYGLSPLSYRSVDEESYKEAVLVFYELNSLVPIKAIFMNQYIFATENYLIR